MLQHLTHKTVAVHDAIHGTSAGQLGTVQENTSFRADLPGWESLTHEEAALVNSWNYRAWVHKEYHQQRSKDLHHWHVLLTGLQTFASSFAIFAIGRADVDSGYHQVWSVLAVCSASSAIAFLLTTRLVQPSVRSKQHHIASVWWNTLSNDCKKLFEYNTANNKKDKIRALCKKFANTIRESPLVPPNPSNKIRNPEGRYRRLEPGDFEVPDRPTATKEFTKNQQTCLEHDRDEADQYREAAYTLARNQRFADVILNTVQTFLIVLAFLSILMAGFKMYLAGELMRLETELEKEDVRQIKIINTFASDDVVCHRCAQKGLNHTQGFCSDEQECLNIAGGTCLLCKMETRGVATDINNSWRGNGCRQTMFNHVGPESCATDFIGGSYTTWKACAVTLNTFAALLATMLGTLQPEKKTLKWQHIAADFAEHTQTMDMALKSQPHPDASNFAKALVDDYLKLKNGLKERNSMPRIKASIACPSQTERSCVSDTSSERGGSLPDSSTALVPQT